MPKVSIIIPIFNVENYLKQCLESIINQTLKDIEIICVNDGSTDSCGEILDEYAKKDKRIKAIHKINTGYGNSMNIALDNVSGEYIGIVESDDFIEPTMFETLYDKAKSCNAQFVKSDHNWVYSKSNGELQIAKSNSIPSFCKEGDRVFRDEVSTEDLFMLFQIKRIWTNIYSTEFIKSNNIRFNETPGASYQDTSFLFAVVFNYPTMTFVDEAFYNYRIDNPTASMKSKGKITAINDEYNFMHPLISRIKVKRPEIARFFYEYWFKESNGQFKRFHEDIMADFVVEMKKFIVQHEKEMAEVMSEMEKSIANFINKILSDTEFVINKVTQYKRERDLFIENFTQKVKKHRTIIYGAGKVGTGFLSQLNNLWLSDEIECFAVTKLSSEENENFKIIEIDSIKDDKTDYFVIIAVGEKLLDEMEQNLKKLGITNYISHLEVYNHMNFHTAYKTMLGE